MSMDCPGFKVSSDDTKVFFPKPDQSYTTSTTYILVYYKWCAYIEQRKSPD